MKKLIFITGVAGMVGSNLLGKYINTDNLIIGIDSLVLGKKSFLKPFLKKKNFLLIKKDLSKKLISLKLADILNKNKLSEIWLLAANSDIKKGSEDIKVDLKDTFLSTINSMEFLKNYINNKTKIIFTSSSAIYGKTYSKISENNTLTQPASNYGAMKLASEAYLSSFSNKYNCKISVFRFPNVIGKNLTHGLLYDMKKKILSKNKYINVLGNGEQQKPYSHVEEIIKCMIFFKNKKSKTKINYFNIGYQEKGMKVKEIVSIMAQKFKSDKKIIYQKSEVGWIGDVNKYEYSTKKINNLGFNFKINSKKSIELAINHLL